MRCFLVLSSWLFLAALTRAAPTDDCPVTDAVTTEEPTVPAEEPKQIVGYRKETLDTLHNESMSANEQTSKKEKKRIKVKHLKNGDTVTIIKDNSRTKTKKNEVDKTYDKVDHSVVENGTEDTSEYTKQTEHQVKEVDVVKKKTTERIVTDKYGNVVSDTTKSKVKEKEKKKEKSKQSESLVQTHKQLSPEEEAAQIADISKDTQPAVTPESSPVEC